jgi:ABC-type transport system substrate-binding protein
MQDKRVVSAVLLTALIAISSTPAAFAFIYSDGSEDDNFEIFGPRIDKLIVRKYASLDAEMAALQNGEIDVTDSPLTKTWVDTLATDSKIRLASYDGDNGYYTINFNHNNNTYLGNPPDPAFPNPVYPNPMSEVALRQACAHLINRTALVAGPGQGLYEPVYTPMPAYMNFWKHPEINLGGGLENLTYPQNLTGAAKILEQGGFPMGPDDWRYWDMNRNGVKDSGEEFTLKIYTRSDALRAGAAEMLEAGFANPLIRIHNLVFYPPMWPSWPSWDVSKDYHIYMAGWIYVGPDPDYLWDLYHWDNYYQDGSSNCPNYGSISINDPIMQEQLENIKFGLDDATVSSACLAFQ